MVQRTDRSDLTHLTISWSNASGEIDLHLTNERVPVGTEGRHRPVFRFHESAFADATPLIAAFIETQFKRPLLASYRRFRPGWLARKGYLVFLPPEDLLLAHLASLAPKRGGKHRVQKERIVDGQYSLWMADHLYPATVLRFIDGNELGGPVQLLPSRRRTKHDAFWVGYMRGPDGRYGWWGIPQRDLRRIFHNMNRKFDDVLRQLTPDHAIAFETIVSGLALEEVPGLTKAIANFRSLLASTPAKVAPLGDGLRL